jgi:hypothetical protein
MEKGVRIYKRYLYASSYFREQKFNTTFKPQLIYETRGLIFNSDLTKSVCLRIGLML